MHTINHSNITGKEDLKNYGESELSLRVFNDEYLYKMRHNKRNLISFIDELFDYTNEQLMELEQDLTNDYNS